MDPAFRRPLSETWPAPPWEKAADDALHAGRPAEELALVRALRDVLRTSTGRQREQRLAGSRKRGLRQMAMDLIEGEIDRHDVERELNAVAPREALTVERTTVLYTVIGHAHDLMHYEARNGGHRMGWYIQRTGMYPTGNGNTLEEAAANLGAKLLANAGREKDQRSHARFEVRYQEIEGVKQYGVWRQGNGRRIKVRDCGTSLADARRVIAEESDELEAWWDRWRKLPESRRATNAPRAPIGTEETESPDEFTERYRFRGVQFGNWVEGERRRTDLRDTSQGLADLARVLDWPLEALSLGGDLALAFGARGKGGARRVRAHYEPSGRVIAISKPLGPGTLAHEWFHALDHRIGQIAKDTSGSSYATENGKAGLLPIHRLSAVMGTFGYRLRVSEMHARSRKLDHRRPKSAPYWSTVIEMAARAFEAWTHAELAKLGIRNDYLVNYVGVEHWEGDAELDQGYPYPHGEDLESLSVSIAEIAAAGREIAGTWSDVPLPASRS